MTCKEFDKTPLDFRKEIISAWSGEKLVDGYGMYSHNWNPADFDRCDTYNLIKAEIVKRCSR